MLTGEAIKVSSPSAAQVASLPFSNPPASSGRSRELKSQEEGGATLSAEVSDTLEVSDSSQKISDVVADAENRDTAQIDETVQKTKEEKEALEEAAREKLREERAEAEKELALRFGTDEETGTEFFQFVDKNSGDVVRQIPSENILEFMKRFNSVSGLLFSEQA